MLFLLNQWLSIGGATVLHFGPTSPPDERYKRHKTTAEVIDENNRKEREEKDADF